MDDHPQKPSEKNVPQNPESDQEPIFFDPDEDLKPVLEAILFATPETVSMQHLQAVIAARTGGLEPDSGLIQTAIEELNQEFEETGRTFQIKKVGGGYTFATREEFHPWLAHIQHENAFRKISQSALETLAIVAYRQPVTKPEVDHIRGVDSGYVVRQLLEKGLIDVAGRNDSPGRPLLYKTSERFLRHFGLNSIEELPKPREIEEILQDDDMARHRQLMMELKAEIEQKENEG